MLQQLQTMVQQFEARIQTLTDTYQSEIDYKQSKIDSLTKISHSEIESKQSEIRSLETCIQTFAAANQSMHSEIDSLTRKQREIVSLRAEVERLLVQSPLQQAHSQPSHNTESDIQNQVHRYKK